MSSKIIIRADGGKHIGMGHISRASLISDYLFKNFTIRTILITKNDEKSILFLKNKRVILDLLRPDISLSEEVQYIKKVIYNENISLFILDDLENDLNLDFLRIIRSTNTPIAVITDDSFKRVVEADVVINGNPCQSKISYKDENGQYFIGPSFFIMDDEYNKINKKKYLSAVRKIIITIGGSDHNNMIFKVLEAVDRLDMKLRITVITSYGTGYIPRLKEYVKTLKKPVELLIDIPGIVKELGDCDFAITAGGNTLFERIAAMKPGVTICQLDRQMEIADKFAELGVNYNLGYGPEMSAEEIFTKISSYLHKREAHLSQIKKAPEYVDGNGLSRVANIFVNLIRNNNELL